MFYRRKIILSLLEAYSNEIPKISFEPLLYLFTRYQEKPAFDFVYHATGYFSFQCKEDMRVMITDNVITDSGSAWKKVDEHVYKTMLKPADKQVLLYLVNRFGHMTTEEIQTFIQKNYPFNIRKPNDDSTVLFTIGYEGRSLEMYLNTLIENNIVLLCDVRKNAFSMKFGFSKNTLQPACNMLGIEYVHIPDLGIDSGKRQAVVTEGDHNRLFTEYEKITLIENSAAIEQVMYLLKKYKRIALTCFEADYCNCHRGVLAGYITRQPGWKNALVHL